ncbi:hypothetical protein TAFFO16_238 [Bacillus phage Taffo16]|uniref:Uncharacterized protein n=1 Tax=Bacillus phage Taffo16 TaxID=2030094 RepID=A0A249XVG7_9CAUD|nr:hypothetical protein TAFFO16_238 [Bacillus phage Taffo16]ULF48864.1 membrane protein [Bacillus phage BillyBob]
MGLLNKGDYILGGVGLSLVLVGVATVSNGYTITGVSSTTLGGIVLGLVIGINWAAKVYQNLVEKGEL